MRTFLIKVSLFAWIILALCWVIALLANGKTDDYYLKFTSPKQRNLLLGTSKTAQGLQPKVLDKALGRTFFNYSFAITYSPYGPAYLKSIKSKLDPEVKDGIFLLGVDPWSISHQGEDPNDSTKFVENDFLVANTSKVNINPNLEYLFENLKGKYYTILFNRNRNSFLHDDGWLEVTVPMDASAQKSRINKKVKEYQKTYLPNRKLSTLRIRYLQQTVEYLKQHGKVYLVRLPLAPEMYAIEQGLMPDFNEVLEPVIQLSNGYLDLTPDNHLYQYTDGNHLWKESGKQVSQRIANWISQN